MKICLGCGKEFEPSRNSVGKYCGQACYHSKREQDRDKNNRWKGGRTEMRGYKLILLSPDDFFYPMARKDGYVLEHRLVMAKRLGRCLQPWELVHHRNGVRIDNRKENLSLVMVGVHSGKVSCPFCHREFAIR